MLQINPCFTLDVPHMNDSGTALFVTDYHFEEDLYWVIAMHKDGAIVMLKNSLVRMPKNFTIGRTLGASQIDTTSKP